MVFVLEYQTFHPATFSMEFSESLTSAINEASTKGLQQNMVKTGNLTYYYEVQHWNIEMHISCI